MCSAVVGLSFSYGAGLCGFVRWTHVPFKLCCFQSLPRGGHQHKTRDRFCFVFFLFPFLFAFSGTQGFSEQSVFWLYAWPFWFFFRFCHDGMWFWCVCVCQTEEKNVGDQIYFVMFSVKLGNLMTHLPKHPCLNIWYDPSFCLFAWRKLFPKLQWLWFSWLPAMYRCMCYVIETTLSICAWYIAWGWPDPQRVFFFLKIKRYCIPKWREDVGRGVKISRKKCQYCYWVIFFVFFALLQAMNLFHLYKKNNIT